MADLDSSQLLDELANVGTRRVAPTPAPVVRQPAQKVVRPEPTAEVEQPVQPSSRKSNMASILSSTPYEGSESTGSTGFGGLAELTKGAFGSFSRGLQSGAQVIERLAHDIGIASGVNEYKVSKELNQWLEPKDWENEHTFMSKVGQFVGGSAAGFVKFAPIIAGLASGIGTLPAMIAAGGLLGGAEAYGAGKDVKGIATDAAFGTAEGAILNRFGLRGKGLKDLGRGAAELAGVQGVKAGTQLATGQETGTLMEAAQNVGSMVLFHKILGDKLPRGTREKLNTMGYSPEFVKSTPVSKLMHILKENIPFDEETAKKTIIDGSAKARAAATGTPGLNAVPEVSDIQPLKQNLYNESLGSGMGTSETLIALGYSAGDISSLPIHLREALVGANVKASEVKINHTTGVMTLNAGVKTKLKVKAARENAAKEVEESAVTPSETILDVTKSPKEKRAQADLEKKTGDIKTKAKAVEPTIEEIVGTKPEGEVTKEVTGYEITYKDNKTVTNVTAAFYKKNRKSIDKFGLKVRPLYGDASTLDTEAKVPTSVKDIEALAQPETPEAPKELYGKAWKKEALAPKAEASATEEAGGIPLPDDIAQVILGKASAGAPESKAGLPELTTLLTGKPNKYFRVKFSNGSSINMRGDILSDAIKDPEFKKNYAGHEEINPPKEKVAGPVPANVEENTRKIIVQNIQRVLENRKVSVEEANNIVTLMAERGINTLDAAMKTVKEAITVGRKVPKGGERVRSTIGEIRDYLDTGESVSLAKKFSIPMSTTKPMTDDYYNTLIKNKSADESVSTLHLVDKNGKEYEVNISSTEAANGEVTTETAMVPTKDIRAIVNAEKSEIVWNPQIVRESTDTESSNKAASEALPLDEIKKNILQTSETTIANIRQQIHRETIGASESKLKELRESLASTVKILKVEARTKIAEAEKQARETVKESAKSKKGEKDAEVAVTSDENIAKIIKNKFPELANEDITDMVKSAKKNNLSDTELNDTLDSMLGFNQKEPGTDKVPVWARDRYPYQVLEETVKEIRDTTSAEIASMPGAKKFIPGDTATSNLLNIADGDVIKYYSGVLNNLNAEKMRAIEIVLGEAEITEIGPDGKITKPGTLLQQDAGLLEQINKGDISPQPTNTKVALSINAAKHITDAKSVEDAKTQPIVLQRRKDAIQLLAEANQEYKESEILDRGRTKQGQLGSEMDKLRQELDRHNRASGQMDKVDERGKPLDFTKDIIADSEVLANKAERIEEIRGELKQLHIDMDAETHRIRQAIRSDKRRTRGETAEVVGSFAIEDVGARIVTDPRRKVLDSSVLNGHDKDRFTLLAKQDPSKGEGGIIPNVNTESNVKIVGYIDVAKMTKGKYWISNVEILDDALRSNEKVMTGLLSGLRDHYVSDGKYLGRYQDIKGGLPAWDNVEKYRASLGASTLRSGINPDDIRTTAHSIFEKTRRYYQSMYKTLTGDPHTIEQRAYYRQAMFENDLNSIPADVQKALVDSTPRTVIGKMANFFDMLGDMKVSNDEKVRYSGKVIDDKTLALQARLRWIEEFKRDKIEGPLSKSNTPDKEHVLTAVLRDKRTAPDAGIAEAANNIRQYLDSIPEEIKLKERGLYVDNYFPLIADMEKVFTKIKGQYTESWKKYGDLPANMQTDITPQQFLNVQTIVSKNNSWRALTSIEKTLIQRDALQWQGIWTTRDSMPEFMKDKVSTKVFNQFLQPRNEKSMDMSVTKTNAVEVISQYMRTMELKNYHKDLLDTLAPVVNSMGSERFYGTKRYVIERKIKEMLNQPVVTEQVFQGVIRQWNDTFKELAVDPNITKILSGKLIGRTAQGALGPDTAVKHMAKALNSVVLEPGMAGEYWRALVKNAKEHNWKLDPEIIEKFGMNREVMSLVGEDTGGTPRTWKQVRERLAKISAEEGGEAGKLTKKGYMLLDTLGNKWLTPMTWIESVSKGLTFQAYVAKEIAKGRNLTDSYTMALKKVSEMVPDLTVPALYHEAYTKTMELEFGYGKRHKSPLMSGPLATMSTVFWNYPFKQGQLLHNGLVRTLESGEYGTFMRFLAHTGLHLSLGLGAIKLTMDVSSMFGHILPVSLISIPWEIGASAYQMVTGDSKTRKQGWEHFLNALGILSIPGYRYGKKILQSARDIDEGLARSQSSGKIVREASIFSEVMGALALPVPAQKDTWKLVHKFYEVADEDRGKHDELVNRGVTATMKNDLVGMRKVFEEANKLGIPLHFEDIKNVADKRRTVSALEEAFKRLKPHLQEKMRPQYDKAMREAFPSRYEVKFSKQGRSMWSNDRPKTPPMLESGEEAPEEI